ncbi:MAG: TonB-dependent receptor, partial [Gemmatimonadota bacterium]|nr:TonB-dependent receptor [Gemmatimonadota bacterium]MDE2986315.1 TonB-dependent receptor [Gemmatimonadota bacterium]
MKSRLFLIGALIALAQPGLAAAQGTLRGTVTAAGTGAAVEGAQVTIAGLNMGANTMAGGAYEITGIPAGTHEVEVRLIGYQLVRREVTITDGGTARLDVALATMAIELGGLVAVGSRAQPRTVTESPVPVDVIPTREIVNQADTDLLNLIRNVVPSLNANIQPISDAATFARPANLRGLAPDHTLVLVNGKRRHRT